MNFRSIIILITLFAPLIAHADPQLAEQAADAAYTKASSCYHTLMLNEPKQKQRGNWEICMKQFAAIYRDYDDTAKAPDALFTLGKMYRLLSQQSHNKEDAKEAYNRFDDFTKRYKKNRLNDDALYEMACIKLYTFSDESKAKRLLLQIIRWDPDGDRAGDAKILLAKIKSGKVHAGEAEPLKPQGALLQNKPKQLLPVQTNTKSVRGEPVEPQVSPSTGSGRTDVKSAEKKSPNL